MKRGSWCRWSLILPLAAVGLLSPISEAEGPPPRNLHLENDHWTAWNPPTSFPEGSQVHIIVRGDTLWDLAETFYGDPYLWPQLWERNRYIERYGSTPSGD